ncbi:MAG: hypothetical protein IKN44_05845 [Bacteroidaceae bacterium]|nr:hypothetical protein [Bacteroidaceae bacterium]MBR3619255.1 hypothetical protein [Bacteroidaceae bacterium]
MKNRIWWTFLLVLIVVAVLIGLFYLPRISVADVDLRRVNILSDVQQRDEEGNIVAEVKADEADGFVEKGVDSAAIEVRQMSYVDTVPKGMVAIEDFADDRGVHREMDHFYSALNAARQRPVRVAYFGDSYIEGDILTMDLRGLLQQKYGGKGVGFVEIACVSSDFRRSATTKRSGWNRYHANEKGRGFKANLQGPAGSYFIPSGTATYEIRGQKNVYANLLDTADMATVFFTPGNGLNISYTLNGGTSQSLFSNGTAQAPETYDEVVESLDSDSVVQYKTVKRTVDPAQQGAGNVMAKSINGRIGRFSMSVSGGQGSRFYGVALDAPTGIAVDNFSMRGSGGQHLGGIPQETLRSFASLRPYDLIILHYGLNVANPKQKDYSAYVGQLGKVIDHLKEAYPHASILVVSMGDRDKKGNDGQLHTMGGVKEMVSFERKMASDHRVAFWNLYEAMGGDGSLAKMTEKKQANLDYTHINFAGGRYLAGLLFDVLMNGKENYDNRVR